MGDREAGIEEDGHPLAFYEQSNPINMTGVLLQHEQSIHQFWIFLDHPCYCRQKVAIPQSTLDDILRLEHPSQSFPALLPVDDRLCHFEQLVLSGLLCQVHPLVREGIGRVLWVDED